MLDEKGDVMFACDLKWFDEPEGGFWACNEMCEGK